MIIQKLRQVKLEIRAGEYLKTLSLLDTIVVGLSNTIQIDLFNECTEQSILEEEERKKGLRMIL